MVRQARAHTGELYAFTDSAHYRGIFGTIGTITREEGFRSVYFKLEGTQRCMPLKGLPLSLFTKIGVHEILTQATVSFLS